MGNFDKYPESPINRQFGGNRAIPLIKSCPICDLQNIRLSWIDPGRPPYTYVNIISILTNTFPLHLFGRTYIAKITMPIHNALKYNWMPTLMIYIWLPLIVWRWNNRYMGPINGPNNVCESLALFEGFFDCLPLHLIFYIWQSIPHQKQFIIFIHVSNNCALTLWLYHAKQLISLEQFLVTPCKPLTYQY